MKFFGRDTAPSTSVPSPPVGNKGVGALGEEIASNFLTARGYRILERNFRCRGGEVDIIAREGGSGCLVFVEVKARRGLNYGVPQLAVTRRFGIP